MQALTCPKCGGALSKGADKCSYCGIGLIGAEIDLAPSDHGDSRTPATRGKAMFIAGFVGAVMIYIGGWRYENIDYWLDDRAVVLWAGVLPLWLAVIAFLAQGKQNAWILGFIPALFLFVTHLGLMWFYRGSINDDSVGIAAMFAGAALAGWLAGCLFRYLVTRYRALK